MKNCILPIVLVAFFTNSCIKSSGSGGKNGESGFSFSFGGKEGKGPIKDKTITAAFTGVEISNSLNTEIFKSEENKVIISAPDDILDFIEAKVQSDGTIKIGVISNSGKNISTNKVLVKVYSKQLKNIEVNSSSSVAIKDKFSEDQIKIDVNSSAFLTGNLEANKVVLVVDSSAEFKGEITAKVANIDVNSSARAVLSGTIQSATITADSSAEFMGENLKINSGSIAASSSAAVKAGVSGNLSADASSSASIIIKKTGSATITQSTSSSGQVTVL